MFTSFSSSSSRHRGFTLIELLVVIAIIAILAAILFPVFGRARENGRRTSCSSNLKQIGMGFMQYSQDYDEYLPMKSANGGYGYGPQVWLHAIQPYVKSYQVLKCPSDTVTQDPRPNADFTSYGMNAIGSFAILKLAGNNALWPYFPPISEQSVSVHLASVEAAATTVQALESNRFQFFSRYATLGSDGLQPVTTTNPRTMAGGGWEAFAIERHMETTNVLWVDGHVKAMKLTALRKEGEAIPGTSEFAATYFTAKADPE